MEGSFCGIVRSALGGAIQRGGGAAAVLEESTEFHPRAGSSGRGHHMDETRIYKERGFGLGHSSSLPHTCSHSVFF